MLASHISETSGFFLWANHGWFAKTANSFVTTDSGDLFTGQGNLKPQPNIASQIKAVVKTLLNTSSFVIFQAAWGGEEKDNQWAIDVNEARFAELLDGDRLKEKTPYRITLSKG